MKNFIHKGERLVLTLLDGQNFSIVTFYPLTPM